MTPAIRPATLDDLETLARFAEAMARETEEKTLDPAAVRAGIRAVLTDAEKGFYRVAEYAGEAEHAGEMVGALMVTTEWSDWRNGVFWWIQSVYVRPEARRRGVYKALHAHVQSEAKQHRDVCGLRLYVEANNAAAQRTYEAMGMQRTAYRMFETEW
jgi:ribosomal protein S18 acetylase RimI-like enzyme